MLQGVESWLRAAATRVHEAAPSLTALDQAIGDGDHGINLDRGFGAIVAMLDERPSPEDGTRDAAATADLLRQAGKTLISKVGGASGPLYGTAFLRGAGAVAGDHPSAAAAFVAALEAATGGIAALGKSAEGEKTMLDALFPAARAARASLDGGGDLAAVTGAARDAAGAGAEATIPMLATKGRASYLGERSIGHQDPGATSAALLLAVVAEVAGAAAADASGATA
ncbi:MAG TPA: dihydroxyacetone kinase subunit DhaL [Candidatus Limnocylindrales bacterium]|nr:dihydroxyacetone kinase subunit DhaL [Candidatus Limnocylindrales bacterium]